MLTDIRPGDIVDISYQKNFESDQVVMHRGLVLSFKRRNSWTAALELAIRFGYSIWMYVNKVHLSCPFAESEEN